VSTFNLSTGQFLYSGPAIGGGFIQQLGLFVGPDGTVYAPRSQNNVATDFLVAFVDIDTGLVEKWRVPLGFVPFASFGVGTDGSVYSYTREKHVIRIDPETGAVIDSSEAIVADFFQPRMAIDTAGTLFITNGGFSQGALYSFNPDLTTRWTVPITNVNIGGPAIGRNGTLVVCGVGTDVRAYRGASVEVADHGAGTIADSPVLFQNYPNPFNPSTTISFNIPAGTHGDASLLVFNLLGEKVATLVSDVHEPGIHEVVWNAGGPNGASIASGVYIYQLRVGEYQQSKRLLLLN
jgi:hypothetical protein